MPSVISAEMCNVPASGSSASPQGHALRLDIQGLRAVAVGLVVLSHAGVSLSAAVTSVSTSSSLFRLPHHVAAAARPARWVGRAARCTLFPPGRMRFSARAAFVGRIDVAGVSRTER